MRIALIHSDFLEFEAKKKTKVAEDIPDDMKQGRVEEALVCFLAVEKADEADVDAIALKVSNEIVAVAEQVKPERIVLYPYVHFLFGAEPAGPNKSIKILKRMETFLQAGGWDVHRSPFGWYKGFTIKCKGHPLSELTRIIYAGEAGGAQEEQEVVSQALKEEEEVKHTLNVLTPNGSLHPSDSFNYQKFPDLKRFYNYEVSGVRSVDRIPPHVTLMQRLEIADYEPGSDQGNMRWYPKGELIKNLLEDHITGVTVNYGGMPVETPLMYDYHHPALEKYLNRFPARQYTLMSGTKKYFMRFAACFGQFLMKHNMNITYRNLPLRMYELTRYSFRREQAGELVGLRRLRAFTMPDMHTVCKDMAQSKSEFFNQYKLSCDIMDDLGLNYQVVFRVVKDFYEDNKEWVQEMIRIIDRPALIEIWDKRYAYFVVKFEFNFVDALDKCSALSTVQIDVENSERFSISYVDEKDSKHTPLLLHCSISGAVERDIYAMLETAHMTAEKGGIAQLPVWLAPTQVRVIPVAERHKEGAEALTGSIRGKNIRVDIDDTDETVGKRIRNAEKEWIPYIIVFGDKEADGGELAVRVRSTKKQEGLSEDNLVSRIKEETADKPFRHLYLPMRLSVRPTFR